MAWARYDDRFHSHRKVLAVLAEKGGEAAICLHVLANTWQAEQKLRGHVPEHLPERLMGRRGNVAAALLLKHGLFDVHPDGGWQFHDADDYGPPADLTAKRAAAGRLGGSKPRSKPEANASEDDKQTGEQNGSNSLASARGNPVPVPEPIFGPVDPAPPETQRATKQPQARIEEPQYTDADYLQPF